MYPVNLLATFFITGITLLALKPVAIRVGLVDLPGGRKTHLAATPLVGGIGIFLGVLIILAFTPELLGQYAPLLSLSALVLFIGAVDDAKNLTATLRLTGQALIVLAMGVVADVRLESLGDLFFGGEIELGILTLPLTVFACVGVINAINMADGVDGLSGGLVISSLSFLAIIAFATGDITQLSFITLLICAILAFLSLNFRRPWNKKALVYLGDAGSTMLGFMLAWLFIQGSQGPNASFSPVYALWFLAIPLFDTVNLLIRRPLAGISPFSPGVDHLHHHLLEHGFSVEQVVFGLVSISLLMGGIGLVALFAGVSDGAMFLLFLALFTIYFFASEKMKPHSPIN